MRKNMPQSVADVERRAMGNGGGAEERKHPAFRPVSVNGSNVVAPTRALRERKAPILFRFEAPGQIVEGVLLTIEQVEVAEKIKDPRTGEMRATGRMKPAIEYVVFNPAEEQPYKILGTYDINSKLSRQDQGRYVAIIYKGENPEIKKNGQAMKVFHIGVEDKSGEARKLQDSTKITDEDIPF